MSTRSTISRGWPPTTARAWIRIKVASYSRARSNLRSTAKGDCGFRRFFPNLAKHADEMCLLNGMHTDTAVHPQATIQMHTGNFPLSAAVDGRLDGVWPGNRKHRVARLLGDRSGRRRRDLRQFVPAGVVSGHADRRRGRQEQEELGRQHRQSQGLRRTAAPATRPDRRAQSRPAGARQGEPRARRDHRIVRAGVPHGRRRARDHGSDESEPQVGARRLWRRRCGARTSLAGNACSRGGSQRRACGLSSWAWEVGTSTTT